MKNVFRVFLTLGMLADVAFLERRHPLRSERESKVRRMAKIWWSRHWGPYDPFIPFDEPAVVRTSKLPDKPGLFEV